MSRSRVFEREWDSGGYEHSMTRDITRRLGFCRGYEACPFLNYGIVVNIDGYSVEESLLPGMTYSIWAWRSLTSCIADLMAVGARPLGAGYSLGVREPSLAWEVAYGFLEASRYYGLEILKNDLNSPGRGKGWIDVYCIGSLDDTVPTPNTTRQFKNLYIIQLGYTGYGLLEKKILAGDLEPSPRIAVFFKRKIPVNLYKPIKLCKPKAVRDNSDGFGYTMNLLFKEANNNRLFRMVDKPLYDPRLDSWIPDPSLEDLLGSWEDYNLLVVADSGEKECILDIAGREGIPARVVALLS